MFCSVYSYASRPATVLLCFEDKGAIDKETIDSNDSRPNCLCKQIIDTDLVDEHIDDAGIDRKITKRKRYVENKLRTNTL